MKRRKIKEAKSFIKQMDIIESTTRFQRVKESLSQLLCVIFVNGDADEMLSSYSWRTQSKKMISWLDWLLGSGHCEESYLWEKEHYNVDRFKEEVKSSKS